MAGDNVMMIHHLITFVKYAGYCEVIYQQGKIIFQDNVCVFVFATFLILFRQKQGTNLGCVLHFIKHPAFQPIKTVERCL